MGAFATAQTGEARAEQVSTAPSGDKCDSSAPVERAEQHPETKLALFSDLAR